MPSEYRLIPVSVTAIQLTPETFERAQVFSGGVAVTEIDALDSKQQFVALNIPTIRGVIRAGQGDWIVKDRFGMIMIMTNSEFTDKYEKV